MCALVRAAGVAARAGAVGLGVLAAMVSASAASRGSGGVGTDGHRSSMTVGTEEGRGAVREWRRVTQRYVLLDGSLEAREVGLVALEPRGTGGGMRLVIEEEMRETSVALADAAALVPVWWTAPGPSRVIGAQDRERRAGEGRASATPEGAAEPDARALGEDAHMPNDAGDSDNSAAVRGAGEGVITLVDGQVIRGRPAVLDSADPDSIVWASELLGTVVIRLEDVARVEFGTGRSAGEMATESGTGAAGHAGRTSTDAARAARGTEIDSTTKDAAQDLVVLANGDTISGFVESIDASANQVLVSVGGGAGARNGVGGGNAPVSTPLDAVRVIELVNPKRTASGSMLWLADGSVLASASITLDPRGGGGGGGEAH